MLPTQNFAISLALLAPDQCPTGTRYPTRTRSFYQYPIHTRFIFKIIGYFGYRVFQNPIFLTRKTAPRSYKILTKYHLISSSFDKTGLVITYMYCGPISMGPSSIIMSPLCFHGFSICYCTKLQQDYQRWRNSTGGNGIKLFTEVSKKDMNNGIRI